MFAVLIHEGEVVVLPSGHDALVLGMFAGDVTVRDLETGEEFEIKPRHLRAKVGAVQPLAADASIVEIDPQHGR